MIAPLIFLINSGGLNASPADFDNLLDNIHGVFQRDDFLKKEFYYEGNLENLFGCAEVHSYPSNIDAPNKGETYYLTDFSSVALPPPPAPGIPAIQVHLSRSFFDDGPNQRIAKVYFSLVMQSSDSRTAQEHIKEFFDYPWVEDPKAEQERFLAIAREPFNPPPKDHYVYAYSYRIGRYQRNISIELDENHHMQTLNLLETYTK